MELEKVINMFSSLFSKKSKYQIELSTRILTLELNNGWKDDPSIEDPLTIYKAKNGKGTLRISVTSVDALRTPPKELLLRSHKPTHLKEYKLKDWAVYEFEEPTKDLYNKSFYFAKIGLFLFVSYYCKLENLDKRELKEAVEMVHSIEVFSKN